MPASEWSDRNRWGYRWASLQVPTALPCTAKGLAEPGPPEGPSLASACPWLQGLSLMPRDRPVPVPQAAQLLAVVVGQDGLPDPDLMPPWGALNALGPQGAMGPHVVQTLPPGWGATFSSHRFQCENQENSTDDSLWLIPTRKHFYKRIEVQDSNTLQDWGIYCKGSHFNIGIIWLRKVSFC